MHGFRDKAAVVTGATSGIGREVCIELAHRGAQVFVADINREGADKTVSMIIGAGGRAESVIADMRDPAAVQELVGRAASSGSLDYMFNNAGIIMFGEFRDMGHEDWRSFSTATPASRSRSTPSGARVGLGESPSATSPWRCIVFSVASCSTRTSTKS
jgi:NAD(P)-dependent dehydrogenase (short-subunit alcohol dehydrogenase family)